MTRLVIVRHGDTFAADEPPRRVGARTDLALTANGERQARTLGQFFADVGLRFGTAWSGPLIRARRTAELVLGAATAAPPLTVMPALDEIDHGPDEDQREDVVRRRLGPAALVLWDAEGVVPDGWRVDADQRLGWWRAVLAAPPPGETLLVTSNGAARFALLALGGVETRPLKLRTGAFGVLGRSADGTWAVSLWDKRPGEIDPFQIGGDVG